MRIVETKVPTTSLCWRILRRCSSDGAGHIGVTQESGRDLPIGKWCKLFTAGGQVVSEVSEVCPRDRLCEEIVAGVLEADLEGMGGFQVGRSCDSEVGWRSREAI